MMETKNDVLGLVAEDEGSYYWMWRTKDVGTRQIKLASTTMELKEYYKKKKIDAGLIRMQRCATASNVNLYPLFWFQQLH